MSDIEIPKTIMISISKLHPSVYNPRQISAKKFKQLKASIREYGFVKPIVVQKKGLNIIGGHQGLKAIIDICKEDGSTLPKVPCLVLSINDRKAKLLNIALNNIEGEFKADMLADLLRGLNDDSELGLDELESAGYELAEVDKLLATAETMMDSSDDLQPFASSITLSVKFDTVEERDTVKAILTERSATDNVKPGTILHRIFTTGE